MTAQKFLAVDPTNFHNHEVEATTVSTGIGDAGKIPALSMDGTFDESLMPATVFGSLPKAIVYEPLIRGDFVNFFDDGGVTKVRLAKATSFQYAADGFVRQDWSVGQTANVFRGDVNDNLLALTFGSKWLSDIAPGKTTNTPPNGSNTIVQFLGKALTTTKMLVNIDYSTIRY